MAAGDGELRIRHGRIQHGNCGAKRLRRQASKDFRVRDDAGREEGRAYRQNFQRHGRAMGARPSPAAVVWPYSCRLDH